MRKFLKSLDPKYVKVCAYASITVILTVVAIFFLSTTGGFWKTLGIMFSAMISPVIIGFIICYLFLPIVHKIEKLLSKDPKPWRRPAAVAIFYLILGLILIWAMIGLFLALKGGVDSLQHINFENIKGFMLALYVEFEALMKSIEKQITSSGLPFQQVGHLLSVVVSGITRFFSSLMFGVIFSIYFMIDEKNIRQYWGRVVLVVHGEKGNAIFKDFVKNADGVFSGYIRGQFMDALIVGTISTVVFMVAGIPYAPVIGLLVGLGNLIPYVGPVVGYGSIIVFCLVTGEFWKMILGLVLMAIIMFVDGNIINPRLLSQNVEVHPLLVIAALLAGGAIGGFLGMVVAVPVAALAKMYFDRLIDMKEEEDKEEEEEKALLEKKASKKRPAKTKPKKEAKEVVENAKKE